MTNSSTFRSATLLVVTTTTSRPTLRLFHQVAKFTPDRHLRSLRAPLTPHTLLALALLTPHAHFALLALPILLAPLATHLLLSRGVCLQRAAISITRPSCLHWLPIRHTPSHPPARARRSCPPELSLRRTPVLQSSRTVFKITRATSPILRHRAPSLVFPACRLSSAAGSKHHVPIVPTTMVPLALSRFLSHRRIIT